MIEVRYLDAETIPWDAGRHGRDGMTYFARIHRSTIIKRYSRVGLTRTGHQSDF